MTSRIEDAAVVIKLLTWNNPNNTEVYVITYVGLELL